MVSICFRSLLIFFGVAQFLTASVMSTGELETLLNRLPAAGPRSLDFRESKTLRLLKDPIISEGTLTVAPPTHFRREIIRPTRSFAVSNGETLWLYYPEFSEAEKYDLTRNSPVAKMIEAITASFDREQLKELFEIQGSQSLNEYELILRPKSGKLQRSLLELRLTLSPDLKLAESILLAKDGSKTTTTYKNERNIRIASGFFDFQPPVGVKITEPFK